MRAGKKQIWILEDNLGAQFVYREILGSLYDLEFFCDLGTFADKIGSEKLSPDLIIADLTLAEGSFLDFLEEKSTARLLHAPFMIVSSVDDAETLRSCFDGGAVDYLTKPFTKSELVVKVERIVNGLGNSLGNGGAQRPHHEPEAAENGVQLDPTALTVRRGTRNILLTAKELRIFSLLYKAEGGRVPRSKLETEVWGSQAVTAKTLDVHLFNLRKKLAKLGVEIRFVNPDCYALHNNRK